MKKPMRDFTLLVGSSFFHGFRKCVVRASSSNELLQAVLSALESQGVHIPPESFPMQILHRDAEFKEALPVANLDMLAGKARVRLEQAPPEGAAEQSVRIDEGDITADTAGEPVSEAATTTPEAEIERLRRTLQDAEARAAAAAALQERCDALSDSLAAVRVHPLRRRFLEPSNHIEPKTLAKDRLTIPLHSRCRRARRRTDCYGAPKLPRCRRSILRRERQRCNKC